MADPTILSRALAAGVKVDQIVQLGSTRFRVAMIDSSGQAYLESVPPPEDGLLTAQEHEAMELLGKLAGKFRKIITSETSVGEHDYIEAVFYIHGLQRMILAQAGSRAYPEQYRLLGGG